MEKITSLKSTFWPMIGGIAEGFPNYLLVLRTVESNTMSRQELVAWLMKRFGLAESYARNVVTTLFRGAGVLTLEHGVYRITEEGRVLLDSASPRKLYHLFRDHFIGIADICEILGERQPLDSATLFDAWIAGIKPVIGARWNRRHSEMQFRHRLDWLRSLEIIARVADGYYLSTAGMGVTTEAKIRAARSPADGEAISHNDIEDKLRMIGEFFEFMSIKRATVNEARPARTTKLSERRQLDCLWARVIHFGGKVQYAFEVQIGGNIADAIERLEMVAPFVQKAVVVTDDAQQHRIEDRLDVKHSPLRDKLVFLSYDDVNQVAAAVNALSVFAGKVFRD
jgi:hypothetical protein